MDEGTMATVLLVVFVIGLAAALVYYVRKVEL